MGNPLPRDPIADAQRNWESFTGIRGIRIMASYTHYRCRAI